MNSNIKLQVYVDVVLMMPLPYIEKLVWNQQLGEKLESLRGKTPRQELSEKLAVAGIRISVQGLSKIEKGLVKSIDVRLIVAICEILGISLDKLFPVVGVEKRVIDGL